MNNEKKYTEALERARMSYHTGDYDKDTLEMLEIIFPELKESEDEKIRKVLIELVKCNERSGYFLLNNVTTSSMIDWLEKQKLTELSDYEQDFVKQVTQRIIKKGFIPTLKGKQKADFENEFNKFKQIAGLINWPARLEVYKNIILWFIIWSKTHLPTFGNEFNKEDEHRRSDAIYFLENAKKHYASTSEIDATIDWLKSLK